MTREEQEQAFNRRVKQNESGAVGEAALSADEQANGQTHKPGISDATNAIVEKTDEAAVRNVKQPATQSALIDADAQQASKENAIDRLLKDRIEANKTEQQKLEENYQAQQKRQRRNAIISSIADGLSALSNMYFVSKGAPTPTATAPSMSEQQAKKNVADRNTYLELLQGWRKRNNELLNNYATYQATAERNRIAAANASLEVEREARLLAKQDWQKVYQTTLMELKAKKIDDDKAKWQAKLAADEKEAESLDRYRKELAAIGRAKVDKMGRNKKTRYNQKFENGQWVITDKEETYE